MKKVVIYSLSLLLVSTLTILSCNNDSPDTTVPEPDQPSINLLLATTQGTANTEITNINLESGQQFSFTIECMIVSSRVYDSATETIGYTSCDNTFVMVNPTTGEQLNAFPLPGPVNMAVINETDHVLIGVYFDTNEAINRVIRLDLDSGELLSDLKVEDIGPMYTCSQFFNQGDQTFSLIRDDDRIVTLDATNGQILSETSISGGTNFIYYLEETNILVGITYNPLNDTNYVEQTNLNTGSIIRSRPLPAITGLRLCAVGFDVASNSLVAINANNRVIYINIDSGEITEDIDIASHMEPITFYAQ